MLYVCVSDLCCVFCLYFDAWSYRCSCMGSMSVSSCRCFKFVSCVHPVAVLIAEFCMTSSLLMLVVDASGDHMEKCHRMHTRHCHRMHTRHKHTTATGCTQDTNIQLPQDAHKTQTYNICMTKHSHSPYTSTYSSTPHNTNRKHNIHHIPYTNTQHISTLQG